MAVTRPLTGSVRFSVCPFGIGNGPSADQVGVAICFATCKAGTLAGLSVERGKCGAGGKFSIQNWGRWEELQTAEQPTTNPMFEVMGKLYANGGMVLHGEQEFTYHRPVVCGQTLHYEGIVRDIYEKTSGDRTMTFIVTEDTYRDEQGEPVLTSTMNLIHRS